MNTNTPADSSNVNNNVIPPAATNEPVASAPPPKPRRRGWRIFKWAVLVLLLLLIGGGLIAYLNLNGIIERTVESQSTASLNLKTELQGARLALFGGKLNLNDLRIANPAGFTAPEMFTLDGVDLNVGYRELRQDPVRVKSITLDRPKLVIENNGGKFNFKKAMELMPKTEEADPNQEPLRLIIDNLTVKDSTVVIRPGNLNIPGITLPEEITVAVPTINMKNIGTDENAKNGAAVKDVVMQVITALAADAANNGKLPADLQNLLKVDVNAMVQGFGKEAQKRIAEALPGEAGAFVASVLDDPNALLKDPGKVLESKGKAIEKGLGGLLNRDRDKKKPKE